jgi:hypothetical protein
MALTGDQVCTAIITKGLGCLPACDSLITSRFSLAGVCTISVVVDGGGGSYPLAPGEIGNLYQPVDRINTPSVSDGIEYYIPHPNQDPFTTKKRVTVIVEFRGKKSEYDFVVTPRKAWMLVKAANFINKTQERISATVSNINRVVRRSAKVLNFRKKR